LRTATCSWCTACGPRSSLLLLKARFPNRWHCTVRGAEFWSVPVPSLCCAGTRVPPPLPSPRSAPAALHHSHCLQLQVTGLAGTPPERMRALRAAGGAAAAGSGRRASAHGRQQEGTAPRLRPPGRTLARQR
jgi:hypothetical protein